MNRNTTSYHIPRTLHNFFMSIVLWREKHIKEKSFVIVLSLIVGILGGFAALILKGLIHVISQFLTSYLSTTHGNWLFFIYPALGIFITVLFVRYVVRDISMSDCGDMRYTATSVGNRVCMTGKVASRPSGC